uniref:VM domain-containing protein n=1 Tax=Syphacia muris TaxID=451379 RepID=A0A0N5A927_9BILA
MVILLICALLLQAPSLTLACFGLGGGCCQPTETCAPSVPPCPAPSASYSQVPVPQPCVSQPCPTGSSYGSSYSGSYSAPASSYSAPGSSYGASYGASAPNYAAASNYALTGAQYGLTKTASFLGGASATGISSSASSFASGNSPVVRKVVTMQKSLPETKLTIEEGEKPESIEIIETEPEKSLTDTESQTNSVVETVPEETIKKANIDGETSQAKTQTPVPIVILPLSTSTSAPASETAATAETAPGEETPLSSEYQSSIDSAYEEIASEEEALKKQVKGLSKADKETEITTVPDSEHEHNEELVATSKEPEKPATLIESYQGYYQEPTAEPVPQSQEQSMASYPA